mmetsp:Transcript_27121/g.94084  ORF Transcript_27121/g.94084 Transcript_27121/m.94084 type:complete len:338 (-) Transcript_27121:297-1310(-)
MCFTQEVSALFACIMWVFAAVWKGPTGARVTVAYFALMETIQAAQYSVLGEQPEGINHPNCQLWSNKALTWAGMIHLCFQPFFSNMFLTQFMSTAQRKQMRLVLVLCLLGGISMMNRFFVSSVDVPCTLGVEPLCGPHTCSFQGSTHVAWQMPLQHCDQDYFTPGFQLHFFLFFLPVFAMGMWRHTLFLLISGPIIGRLLTDHHDEIPAIWCFFSIVQVFAPLFYGWFLDRENKQQAVRRSGAHKKSDDAKLNGNGHSKGAVAVSGEGEGRDMFEDAEAESDDVTGGWTGMAKKAIAFTICLALKRYVTDNIMVGAEGYQDAAVATAAALKAATGSA